MVYPNTCASCDRWLVHGESGICMHCLDEMPRTGYQLHRGNPVEAIFWGRVPLLMAGSFLHFRDEGMVRDMLHGIKYKGRRELATELGKLYAGELRQHVPEFAPDLWLPVPLHPRKLRQRGYNQSLAIADGLAAVLGGDVRDDVLFRRNYTQSQTRKGRFSRWENTGTAFGIRNQTAISGKKVILVDDVVTTGATAEACLQLIVSVQGTAAGFLSLAKAV